MSSTEQAPGSTNTTTPDAFDARDPAGFLRLDASGRPAHSNSNGKEGPVVVRIVGTARDDLNGLLGFCTAYNRDRERYMVRMASVDAANAPNATVMALKPANLAKASTIETYKAQFQQLKTDPRVRQRLSEYYGYASTKCRPFKVEHVAGVLVVLQALLLYAFGLTKTLMLISAVVLLLLILAEDVFRHKKPWKDVAQNFPSRSRVVIEKQFPFLRGKLSDAIAAGIVGLLLAFTVQSVLFTKSGRKSNGGGGGGQSQFSQASRGPSYSNSMKHSPSALTSLHKERLEELYYLGFQDSIDGKDRGHSLSETLERLLEAEPEPTDRTTATRQLSDEDYDLNEIPYSASPLTAPPAPPKTFASRLLSMRTAGSLFYLYRMAMQIGVDPSTGIFSVAQLAANIQHSMPTWQKGMIAFSCYNLVSNLFF